MPAYLVTFNRVIEEQCSVVVIAPTEGDAVSFAEPVEEKWEELSCTDPEVVSTDQA